MKKQKGLHIVEFSIAATAFFIILFSVIEVARALFVWNTITEATRRGARVAVVCPINHTAIKRVTLFDTADSTGDSPILNNLSGANIDITYTNANGGSPESFSTTAYVRVAIQNYQHRLLIPFIPSDSLVLQMPPFATTLPVESLGFVPALGVRQCFGTTN